MGIWVHAWAGDNAGSVLGRQPYRALIDFSYTDTDYPLGLFQQGDLDGTPWYYNIDATCLTPGAAAAIVTKAEEVGLHVYSLELTPWTWGQNAKSSWEPGVHLFAIGILGGGGNVAGAIATVVVPTKIKKVITLSNAALEKMLTVTQRGRANAPRARDSV